MRPRDVAELLLLAALWGGAFLFLRIGAPPFGPVALIALRVGIAALLLLPVLALRGGLGPLRRHAAPLLFMGVVNSVLPFVLFAYATLHLTAGFAAVLNATSPMFTALVAWVWLRERLTASRWFGLVVGMSGVVLLVWDKLSLSAAGSTLAVAACLAGSLFYGIGGNFARRRLDGVRPEAIAAGSQAAATLVLAPFALMAWPTVTPSMPAWGAVLVLGLACTGLAFILYFRLIGNVGPSRAITVTFLIPAFGMLFGAIFLGEPVTARMIAGGLVVLAGTALSTGLVALPVRLTGAPVR